jgi:hypothetical protein
VRGRRRELKGFGGRMPFYDRWLTSVQARPGAPAAAAATRSTDIYWCMGYIAWPMYEMYNKDVGIALFVLLKSQVEKYCSLICCERKTLYHG